MRCVLLWAESCDSKTWKQDLLFLFYRGGRSFASVTTFPSVWSKCPLCICSCVCVCGIIWTLSTLMFTSGFSTFTSKFAAEEVTCIDFQWSYSRCPTLETHYRKRPTTTRRKWLNYPKTLSWPYYPKSEHCITEDQSLKMAQKNYTYLY